MQGTPKSRKNYGTNTETRRRESGVGLSPMLTPRRRSEMTFLSANSSDNWPLLGTEEAENNYINLKLPKRSPLAGQMKAMFFQQRFKSLKSKLESIRSEQYASPLKKSERWQTIETIQN